MLPHSILRQTSPFKFAAPTELFPGTFRANLLTIGRSRNFANLALFARVALQATTFARPQNKIVPKEHCNFFSNTIRSRNV
jgi:hypothetical protein